MTSRLFVGNLAYATGDDALREAFEPHGALVSAQVIIDRTTGQSRGFGFVEFSNAADAQKAIDAMNGAVVDGRPLIVNAAKEREERGGGGGMRRRA